MLGRLPWFAFERRILAFFFLVFFDMGSKPNGRAVTFPRASVAM
jgi:hypothetical protein